MRYARFPGPEPREGCCGGCFGGGFGVLVLFWLIGRGCGPADNRPLATAPPPTAPITQPSATPLPGGTTLPAGIMVPARLSAAEQARQRVAKARKRAAERAAARGLT